ncbi:hypothetical protein [Sphingomonas sp. BK580]|uniref:hypothetical protein n=1 Tax=Sphingomonas sp. BK580 TaxID=2586972 RepID=UPI00161184C3|nr:hypothetical protein [Sphingomonas sp. BK580]MBB3693037.1 hypothetical protein [Sphingomonas sp. BK580]
MADGPTLIGQLARYWAIRGFVFVTPALAIACAPAKAPLPQLNAAPPAPVIAKVAVPVACEIEQVPAPAYPGELIRDNDDIYAASRIAMADRRARIAERDRLRAANSNPCPGGASAPR